MTNFCIFDLFLLFFAVCGVLIGFYASVKVKLKLGIVCLIGNVILPIVLYGMVYWCSLGAMIRRGSTWARLRAFLQGYVGSQWAFWLVIFLYIAMAVYELWLLFIIFNKKKMELHNGS